MPPPMITIFLLVKAFSRELPLRLMVLSTPQLGKLTDGAETTKNVGGFAKMFLSTRITDRTAFSDLVDCAGLLAGHV